MLWQAAVAPPPRQRQLEPKTPHQEPPVTSIWILAVHTAYQIKTIQIYEDPASICQSTTMSYYIYYVQTLLFKLYKDSTSTWDARCQTTDPFQWKAHCPPSIGRWCPWTTSNGRLHPCNAWSRSACCKSVGPFWAASGPLCPVWVATFSSFCWFLRVFAVFHHIFVESEMNCAHLLKSCRGLLSDPLGPLICCVYSHITLHHKK